MKKSKKNRDKCSEEKVAEPVVEILDPEVDQEAVKENIDWEANCKEALDKYMRAKAQMDNYRKRTQREMTELRKFIKASTIQEFLPVCDHFQMAVAHAKQATDIATLKQGMDMILAEFERTFENLGVKKIKAIGELFDPNEHEAISQEASTEIPAEHVLREWKSGYKMNDHLLRPASVVVSSGVASIEEDAATTEEDTEE